MEEEYGDFEDSYFLREERHDRTADTMHVEEEKKE